VNRREKFIEILEKSGWSQTKAARELKRSKNYIYMIVRRGAVPSAPLLELLEIKTLIVRFGLEKILVSVRKLPKHKQGEVLAVMKAVVQHHASQCPKPV